MPAEHPSRWEYRFDNFSRALALLREAAADDPSGLSDLEREGLVQRFEYTFELAWKTLKDRLEYDGLQIPTVTPRNVIRAAFTARFIDAADDWIDMLTDRNRMSHEYDFEVFEEVANSVHVRYLGLLEAVCDRLVESRTSR
jgi:nucleotidyltransferase substrate binding protein (TIGR01987 family)